MGHEDPKLSAFLNVHKNQLIASNVPKHFWITLYEKLAQSTLNAGDAFQILKLEYDEERKNHKPLWALQARHQIDHLDPKHIYLIDHAWTYRAETAKETLMLNISLRDRLCSMFNLTSIDDNLQIEDLVDIIFDNTWKVNNMYTIGNANGVEDKLPVWYIMDEIGISVLHSDSPNCRVVPFYYSDEQITYSLLFPIEDIEEDDLMFRDFAEGITDPVRRSAFLLPWVPKSFREYSIIPPIPGEEYFLSGHIKESLPILSNFPNKKESKNIFKIYTQYNLIKQFLTENRFSVVENEEEADVLWLTEHFKDFEKLSIDSPDKFINQFPFEYVLTVKDLLCVTCRRKNNATWLPLTYNLVTEIPNFVSYFQHRLDQGHDNYWIIKPYNLARSLDIHITDNLDHIMKLAITGPKIVQKYITNPVLFYRPECNGRVKFDIRYVILLKNVKPLTAFVYKEFFLRFANVPFELNDFNNYEKHFTVMNYLDRSQLKHMKCEEFKIHWELQHINFPWAAVEKSIMKMLREILECATSEPPPLGMAESPQSRALYAADLMLEWVQDNSEMQPKLLEINFTPDCKRACDYYPDFFNDVFNLLFIDKDVENFIAL